MRCFGGREEFANNFFWEFAILYKRAAINTGRDPMLTKARFFSTIIPAVIMGLVLYVRPRHCETVHACPRLHCSGPLVAR